MTSPQKRVLITCMGTRGDVQPFVALSVGLLERGWTVALATPGEFKGYVESYGLLHADIGRSLQREMNETPQGKALRTAGPMQVLSAARAFFSVDLYASWFNAIAEACRQMQPDVLVLTSFTQMSGAAIIPRLLGLKTKLVVAHCIPMQPTTEFAVPLSGSGFTNAASFLNKVQWRFSSLLVGQGIHGRTAKAVVKRVAEQLQPRPQGEYLRLQPGTDLELGPQFGLADAPTLFIYSPSLLPKPADWPENCHVVGPLLLRHHVAQPGQEKCQEKRSGEAAGVQGRVGACSSSTGTAGSSAGKAAEGGVAAQPECQGGAECQAEASLQQEVSGDSCIHCPTAVSSEGSSDFLIPASRAEAPGQQAASTAGGSASSSSGSGGSGSSSSGSRAGGSKAQAGAGEKVVLQAAGEAAVGLPAHLQAFLDEAFRLQQPVVYVGLGSMLGTVFEPNQIRSILDSIAEAVTQVSARMPLRAVIHTNLGDGKSGQLSKGVAPGAPFMLLSQPVPHNLLLPQCSLVVHHGGAGTTHATLAAGKPALVVPCVPASDQAFWADLVWRRGLGPRWFHIRHLTPARLAAGLEEALLRLDELTSNAEVMAVALHQEEGVANTIGVIEEAAGLAHPGL